MAGMATTALPFSQKAATVRRRRAERRTTTGAPSARGERNVRRCRSAPAIRARCSRRVLPGPLRRSVRAWTGRCRPSRPVLPATMGLASAMAVRVASVNTTYAGTSADWAVFLAPLPQRIERLFLIARRALVAAAHFAFGAAGQHASADPARRRGGGFPARGGPLAARRRLSHGVGPKAVKEPRGLAVGPATRVSGPVDQERAGARVPG